MMSRRRKDIQNFAFRDVLANGLLAWVLLALLFMAMIKVAAQEEIEAQLAINDTLVFQIEWPEGEPHDIDLWVRGPDGVPVGFSNRAGAQVNLLRDDLGSAGDLTQENWEESRSRGLAPGKWAATVYMWNPGSGTMPVTVEASISVVRGKSVSVIWEGTVDLVRDGDERTLAQFELDAEGHLVPNSLNHLNVKLWGSNNGP